MNNGELLVEFFSASVTAKNNLQKADVIINMRDQYIHSIRDLVKAYQNIKGNAKGECIMFVTSQHKI